ncbi:MAG: hypothetical protein ACH346_05905 [Chthoniobacterales bacterium]
MNFLFPALPFWLFLIWLLQKITKRSGFVALFIMALFSTVVLLCPIHELSVAHWIASFSNSWSILLIGILVVAILEKTFSHKFFSPQDWKAVWFFGAVASLILYPSALGLSHFDSYGYGWHFGFLTIATAVIAIILILKKNQFGILLLLTLAFFDLHLQASTNLWDYLIDPVYGFISLVMALHCCVRSIKRS